MKEITSAEFNRLSKRAAWVSGEGPILLLAHCRQLTITRWNKSSDAYKRKEFIDRLGCGGACCGSHEIVRLAAVA
jgi:hypothetical protein